MITQIIGSAKCRETQKCRRWFDERGIDYQYVNLAKRALSATELSAIARVVSWDDMMDDQGKVWASRQLAWKEFDPLEELLAHPLLLKTLQYPRSIANHNHPITPYHGSFQQS